MADIGLGDLFEDGFGFGERTVKSIRDVLRQPRQYFLAAQVKDWAGYTPSIRVYIILLAISSYLRYLYLGDGQVMTELYVGQFEQVIADLAKQDPRWAEASARDLANGTLERLFFWSPFVSFTAYTLFGMVWCAYAQKLPVVVRIRYIYALMIPATLLMLVITPVMAWAPEQIVGLISFAGLCLSAAAVSVTAYLGAYPRTESAGGKFGRALVLGFALIFVMMLSTMTALMIGTFETMGEIAATLPAAE